MILVLFIIHSRIAISQLPDLIIDYNGTKIYKVKPEFPAQNIIFPNQTTPIKSTRSTFFRGHSAAKLALILSLLAELADFDR